MTAGVEAASRQFMVAAERLPRMFDLADEDLRIIGELDKIYGQDTPDPEAVARLEAEFAGNDALVIRKTEHYLHVIKRLGNLAEMHRDSAASAARLAKAAEAGEQDLRNRLLVAMQTMGRDRIDVPGGVVSVRQNPPSCKVVDAAIVPSEYQRTKIEVSVDRRGILDAFRATGEIPPGVTIVHTDRLDIR